MKTEYSSIKNFLVQRLQISNREAISIISNKQLQINGRPASLIDMVNEEDSIVFNGKVLKSSINYIYLAYYKPRGIETTLNDSIADNLKEALPVKESVFPVGRLDKESEGLLLLTNNGKIYNKIIDNNNYQEKEYIVKVNQSLSEEAISKLSTGIEIMGKITRPAQVKKLSEFEFNIILTQGLNRQIRRMCYKIGYEVLQLKRIRIVNIKLEDLKPGQARKLSEDELSKLFLSI